MENQRRFSPNPRLKLMDQVRQVLRYHDYAYRTEQAYCDWIVRYIKYFCSKKHPRDMGKTEIDGFLSHLATERKVSASTQRQALNPIIFLYRHVLDQPIEGQIEPTRAKRHPRPPVVMTKSEVKRVLEDGVNIRVVQELMGHADVKTTEIYTHVMEKDISATVSLLDSM